MNPATFLASAGGTGFAPKAPGTFGSLIGLLIGCPEAEEAGDDDAGGQNDPGWIVIDEVAGQMIAMLALPRLTWPGLVLAFALFRLFDITKLGPVGWADKRHDAVGVMADDWIAGGLAFIVLLILVHLIPEITR
jgi:phosphatidylglycerophosphatase A